MADDIREDDLLRAIQEAMEKPELDDLPRWEAGTISSGYLRHHYDLTEYAALKILRRLNAAGKLEPALIIYYDVWGDGRRVKGYRLVP